MSDNFQRWAQEGPFEQVQKKQIPFPEILFPKPNRNFPIPDIYQTREAQRVNNDPVTDFPELPQEYSNFY